MIIAWEKGFKHFIFESDSNDAIQLLDKECPSHHPCFSIIQNIAHITLDAWGNKVLGPSSLKTREIYAKLKSKYDGTTHFWLLQYFQKSKHYLQNSICIVHNTFLTCRLSICKLISNIKY